MTIKAFPKIERLSDGGIAYTIITDEPAYPREFWGKHRVLAWELDGKGELFNFPEWKSKKYGHSGCKTASCPCWRVWWKLSEHYEQMDDEDIELIMPRTR